MVMMGNGVTLHMGWSKEQVLRHDVNKMGTGHGGKLRGLPSCGRLGSMTYRRLWQLSLVFMQRLLGIASGRRPAFSGVNVMLSRGVYKKSRTAP